MSSRYSAKIGTARIGYSWIAKLIDIISTYYTDVLLKQMSATSPYSIDVILRQLSQEKTYLADVALSEIRTLNFLIDVALRSQNITSDYLVDALTARQLLHPLYGNILRLSFEEGSGNKTADVSGNNHHATLTNATWTTGKYGNGVYFDGSGDYVSTSSFPMSGTALTFNVWVKCSQNASQFMTILSDGSQMGGAGYLWCVRPQSSDNLTWEYADSSNPNYAYATDFFSGYDGTWVMVTIVCDYSNKTIKFYRNGSQFGTTQSLSGTPLFPSADRVKWFGTYYGGGWHDYLGDMDEPQLFNVALNDDQIAALYNSGPMFSYIIDTILKKFDSTLDYSVDTLLKRLDDTKTYSVDTLIALVNQLKTYSIDILTQLATDKPYSIDVILKKFDTTSAWLIDVALKALDQTKTYSVDTLLKRLNDTSQYLIDFLSSRIDTKQYSVDVLIRKLDTTSTYSADVLLKELDLVQDTRYILNRMEATTYWESVGGTVSLDSVNKTEGDYAIKSYIATPASGGWYGLRYNLPETIDISQYDYLTLWYKISPNDQYVSSEYFLRDNYNAIIRVLAIATYPSTFTKYKMDIKNPVTTSLNVCSRCDAIGSWLGTSVSVDTSDKQEGTGSIKDVVTSPSSDTDYDTYWNANWNQYWWAYRKNEFWLKCDRASSAFTSVQYRLVSSTTGNYYYWNLSFDADEWTEFLIDYNDPDGSSPTPPATTERQYLRPHFIFHTADTTGFTKHIDNLRCGEFDYENFQSLHWIVCCNTTPTAMNMWLDFVTFTHEGYLVDALFQKLTTLAYSIDVLTQTLNTTKQYDVDTLISEALTSPYSIDVRLFKTTTLEYLIDVLQRRTDIKEYLIDVITTFGTEESQYLLDVALKAERTLGYLIDLVLSRSNETKTYLLDTVLKRIDTKDFLIDVVLKDTKTATYLIDALLRSETTKAYLLDVLLRQNDTMKTYLIDACFQNTETSQYLIDAILRLTSEKYYDLDVIFKKFDQTQQYSIDVVLKTLNEVYNYDVDVVLARLNEIKTYLIDVILVTPETSAYLTDVVLMNTTTQTYLIDTYIKGGAEIGYLIDVALQMSDQTKTYLIDTLISQTDAVKTYLVDTLLSRMETQNYLIDFVAMMATLTNFDIDVLLKRLDVMSEYQLDTLFQRLGDMKDYSIDTMFIYVLTSSYIIDVLTKKLNTSSSYFIDTLIMDYYSLDWVIDRELIEGTRVSVPDYLNQNPEIDSNIWSRKIDKMILTARLTNAQLKKIRSEKGNYFRLSDGYYTYTVIIDDIEVENVDSLDHPWKAEIGMFVITYYDVGNPIEMEAPVNEGYFGRQGDIYFEDPQSTNGGGYYELEGTADFDEPDGVAGGGYFEEEGYYTWLITSGDNGYVSEEGTFQYSDDETAQKTLTAYPDIGHSFYRWVIQYEGYSDIIYGNNPRTFTRQGYMNITAQFT